MKKIELSDDLRNLLLDTNCLPYSIEVKGKTYTFDAPGGSGKKSVVWRVKDEYGRPRALKLAISEDYTDKSFLQEFYESGRLEPYNEIFAVPYDADFVKISLDDSPDQTFIAFIEEWIDGVTLKKFLEQKGSTDVSISFFRAYIRSGCKALNALDHTKLRHDDLHTGNVMIVRPAPGALSREWRIKFIDMGSLKTREKPTTKDKDDHMHFVDHLVAIWNKLYMRRSLSVRDRRFLDDVKKIMNSMLDEDSIRALRDPRQIVEAFETAYTRAQSPRVDYSQSLAHPFEFISAEHIPDDRLLVDIFAKSCPWLDKVSGPDPCLVSGPRGCGKSTIFRWLSLRAHLHESVSEIDKLRITGFYVSCSSDLQNRLGWVKETDLAERFEKEIVHYFNLLIAREVVHTLEHLAERKEKEREEYWGFGKAQETTIHSFVMKAINGFSRPLVQGVSLLTQAREAIESEMFNTHSKMLQSEHILNTTPTTFLGDFTTLLTNEISLFRKKRITFLVDDFSLHRLSRPVQVVFNRVIWERRSSHVFKLSSEKHGAVITDPAGATVDITREFFDEIDCGREYIALDDKGQVQKARQFAEDLLNLRLEKAGYEGRAENLIGNSTWPHNSLARALLEKRHDRSADHYHGLDCIARLCSGDVAALLFLYNQIFISAGVKKETSDIISKKIQHDTIVKVSRRMCEHISSHFPHGPQMYDVVMAFGSLIRRILEKGRWQKKGNSTVPPQCPRIELDHKGIGSINGLSEESQNLAEELVRRAIFIEMEPGLSRHKHVTTLRWQLRRIYLPGFYASLSKNDAIKRDIEWLHYFLTNPQSACEMVWKARPKTAAPSLEDGPLFRGQLKSNGHSDD